jgi:phage terminase large subunit GpA-like protein
MLVVQPTGDTAKRFSKLRLSPLVSSTPRLQTKIKEARTRDSGNTIMQKEFPGGALIITGANSAAGLRSMPIKYLMLDETDAYPSDVGGEGNPVTLAVKRTATYKNKKKIFKISTPTFEGRSHIDRDYKKGSQAQYKVPCPHCQYKQVLDFKRLQYEKEEINEEVVVLSAQYACIDCGSLIEEHHKTWMFAEENGAEWVHSYPDRKVKSYQISALYSPYGWYSWVEACQHYEDAQKDTEEMITFTNTVLGECYAEPGEAPDWERIWERAGGYSIGTAPRGVHVITAGVDVQKDRLEITVKGWGKRKRNWAIDHEVFEGSPADDEVWKLLRDYVESTQFSHVSGTLLPISLTAIDSGYCTPEVYTFARRNSKFIVVKGHDRPGPILGNPTQVDIRLKNKVIKRGVLVYPFGASVAKKELYRWLAHTTPEDGVYPVGYCSFPKFDKEYFKQLTAEKLVPRKMKNKFTKEEWIKERDRNEVLDCSTMARAAAYKMGIDKWTDEKWEDIAKTLGLDNIPEKVLPQEKTRVAIPDKPSINGGNSRLKRKSVKSNYLAKHGS